MAEKNKIPEIRFKGFGGEWKWKKLGEVVNLENGFAFKSKYFQDEPTDVIVLTPGSVNIGGGFQRGKGRFYDVAGDFPNKFIFKPDDIFVTMTDLTPTAQALGFPAVVPEDGKTYLHNQRLGKLTGFEGDKFFLFQLLSTEKNQKKIVLTSSGTTVKHTSPQKFLGCKNYFPPKKEQTKIGNYFQQLDTLITLHQRKHDKLLNVKKAMLEKMFPKKGADVPEIRFKGFSEKWEEKELGSESIEIVGYYMDNFCIKAPAITVTGRGDVGHAKARRVDFTPVVRLLTIKTKHDVDFLEKAINNHAVIVESTGVPQLTVPQISKYEIYFPKLKEQTKIGNFFKHLDTLLTLHQAELEKLKNIKKACLEKMFV